MYTGVIFDLDGTLIDSLDDLADTANDMLRMHGFPSHSVDAHKYFVGDGIENHVKRSAPAGTDDATLEKLVEAFGAEYSKHWARKTKPYDGINYVLEMLKKAEIKVAVLTNKRETFAKEVVKHFFTDYPFTAVVGSIAGVRAKPDPDFSLKLAVQMGLKPEQIYFVGDTKTDMDTATNAGMYPVGVTWGFRPEKELIDSGAKKIIHKPEELLTLFNF